VEEVEHVLDTINVERIRDVGVEGIEDIWSVRDVRSGVEGGRVMGRLRTSETLSRLVQSQIWSPDAQARRSSCVYVHGGWASV
jgi:hypothetical protein